MPHYTDVMFDIETTGTGPELNAIIQISAVQFNLKTREVSPDFFDRCLFIPVRRHWDESTRSWWLEKREVLQGIYQRMEEPTVVIKAFYDWLDGPLCDLAGWNKPLSFDTPFISSYFKEFGYQNPLKYWKARDLRSFIDGINHGSDMPFDEKSVPFEGTVHNALHDTLHQLRILFAATDPARCRSSPSTIAGSVCLVTPISADGS